MGLDLPSGGHLTHGYYTAKQLGAVMHRCERKAPRSTRQEEDLRHLHLLRVPALPGAPRALAPTQAPGHFFFLGGKEALLSIEPCKCSRQWQKASSTAKPRQEALQEQATAWSKETGLIDFDELRKTALVFRPAMCPGSTC